MAKISTFVLFCEDYALDALKTFVRMIFDRYAVDQRNISLMYVVDIRHITPENSSAEVSARQYPVSLRGAQDMLISTHDKVSVGSDRVRVNRKGNHKKQKETFPDRP